MREDWSKGFSVFVCGLALAFSSCRDGLTRDVTARILSVAGTAEVRPGGDSEFREIAPAFLLASGALVRTGTGGSLNVAFLPNTLAGLSEQTELQIEKLTLSKDGNATRNDVRARVVQLRLWRGTMQASFSRLHDSKADLIIATPHGELTAASDCIFLVNVTDQKMRVLCVYGTLKTRVEGTDFPIAAGYFQEFPSSRLSPQAAGDDEQAQREVISTMEADRTLQDLVSLQRLERPNLLNPNPKISIPKWLKKA